MKKLILLVLIGLAGWQIYAKKINSVITNAINRIFKCAKQTS
jgi:hypothetical protein